MHGIKYLAISFNVTNSWLHFVAKMQKV